MSTAKTPIHMAEFLPAALEVQDAPPSPVGRAVLWLVLALFALGLAWSVMGQVDIVVTASGRVVPAERVKNVQSAHQGAIANILVSEGDRVTCGQALLELDTAIIRAERARLEEQLTRASRDFKWRSGLEQWFVETGRTTAPFLPDEATSEGRLLAEKIAKISAEILGIEKELASVRAEIEANRAEYDRSQAMLEVLSERVTAYRTLLDNQHGARIQYLEIFQQFTQLQHNLPALDAQQRKLVARVSLLESRISALISGTRADNLEKLSAIQSELATLSHDMEKVLYIESEHTLRAPVDGTVEAMQAHTLGSVVRAGESVLKIVPEGVGMAVDAMIENKDIGFVHEGQEAQIKIETFNFTRYGIVPATVTGLSEDAVQDQHGNWQYKMRLSLGQQSIAVAQKTLSLAPGMTAQVEIKTGTRRIIEFLLSPLIRYGHESMRER